MLAFERIKNILFVGLIFLICTYIYREQIVNLNGGYLKIEYFEWSGVYLISLLISLLIIAFLFPKTLSSPSDLFIFFYLLIVCISFVAFAPGKSELSNALYVQFFFILILPVILLKLLVRIRMPRIVGYNRIQGSKTMLASYMFAVSAFVAVISLYFSPSSASFDLADIYTRRMDARLTLIDGSIIMYANTMVTGAILPMAAAIYGFNRKVSGLVLGIIISFIFYYIDGSKSIFIILTSTYMLGFYISRSKNIHILGIISILIGAFFLVFIIEVMNGQDSMVGQYFFRRFFVIPGVVVAGYIEAFFDSSSIWSSLTGMKLPQSINYYVGEFIFGHKGDNSGTNAFISSLASSGIFGYLIATVVVISFFRLLDMLYSQTGDPRFLFLSIIYVMKLVEQNAFTALGSSGVGLVLILLLVVNYQWENSETKKSLKKNVEMEKS